MTQINFRTQHNYKFQLLFHQKLILYNCSFPSLGQQLFISICSLPHKQRLNFFMYSVFHREVISMPFPFICHSTCVLDILHFLCILLPLKKNIILFIMLIQSKTLKCYLVCKTILHFNPEPMVSSRTTTFIRNMKQSLITLFHFYIHSASLFPTSQFLG